MSGRGRGRGMKKLIKPKEKNKPKVAEPAPVAEKSSSKEKAAKEKQVEEKPVASTSDEGVFKRPYDVNVGSKSIKGTRKRDKGTKDVEDKPSKKRKGKKEKTLTQILGGRLPPVPILPAVRLFNLKRQKAREAAKKGVTNRFPSFKFSSSKDKNGKPGQPFGSDCVNTDEHGMKESLEICQGFSKITLEDWYPFYDFEHHKVHAPDPAPEPVKKPECKAQCSIVNDDDEWEETLVYVDLQDIPDVGGLFSSLASSRAKKAAEEGDVGALSHLEMKIFDLDSKLPVLQLGGRYLAGHWEDTVGTSLFFQKNTDDETEADGASPQPHTSSQPAQETEKLKSIIPEPEIPHDPLFGQNNISKGGYDLVAKTFKVLKTRYFPVVSQVVKKGDVIEDKDTELSVREYQVPPLNMVRQYMTKNCNFDKYMERDTERRRKIRNYWGPESELEPEEPAAAVPEVVVKTEPVEYANQDGDDDDVIFYEENKDNDPVPSTSTDIST